MTSVQTNFTSVLTVLLGIHVMYCLEKYIVVTLLTMWSLGIFS